jgi:hypothetical protein
VPRQLVVPYRTLPCPVLMHTVNTMQIRLIRLNSEQDAIRQCQWRMKLMGINHWSLLLNLRCDDKKSFIGSFGSSFNFHQILSLADVHSYQWHLNVFCLYVCLSECRVTIIMFPTLRYSVVCILIFYEREEEVESAFVMAILFMTATSCMVSCNDEFALLHSTLQLLCHC